MIDTQVAYLLRERRDALNAVLSSATFSRNPRLGKLLEYLCLKAFSGEAGSLKEYTIATDVFGRPADFDQSSDSIVRVEMHRLRKRLKDFYASEGAGLPIEIVIQSGQYVPEFVARAVSEPVPKEIALKPATVIEAPAPPANKKKRWWPYSLLAVPILAVTAWLLLWPRSQSSLIDPGPPVSAAMAPSSAAIRILCGRTEGQIRDRDGNTWGSDAFFNGGTTSELPDQPIYRTNNPVLFRGLRSGDFSYGIPLKQGNYGLHLYFLDTLKRSMSMEGGENTRYFDVFLNGKLALWHLDVISDAGPNTAYERIIKDVSPATDGKLHLAFSRVVGLPILSAIEILPAARHRISPLRISTQDNGFTDRSGMFWRPDNYFLNGRLIGKFGIAAGPFDAQIYAHERYGNFSYALPAAPGRYRLDLHFAETYFGPEEQGGGGAGDRVFDVYCNGVALLRNFDVFSEAGSGRQLVKTFHGIEPNAQGNVLLSFVPRTNYAMVSAIELTDESNQ